MLTGTLGGGGQAPYGRTSSSEFQVNLSHSFHCLLVCNLEISLPFGKDCISVWKRTQYVQPRNFDTSNEKSANDDSVEFMSAEDIAVLLNQTPAKISKKNNEKKTKTIEKNNKESKEEMREIALDMQYLENDDKKWANIPNDEILPIDRACPSLKFLL